MQTTVIKYKDGNVEIRRVATCHLFCEEQQVPEGYCCYSQIRKGNSNVEAVA